MRKSVLNQLLIINYLFSLYPLFAITIDLAHIQKQIKEEEKLKEDEIIAAIHALDELKSADIFNNTYNSEMASILVYYGKTHFYGDSKHQINLPLAYYYFKLASQYGISESLYYLSFFSYYNLDGRFVYMENLPNLKDSLKNYEYLTNHVQRMNTSALILNHYIGSLQGHDVSTFIMGNYHLKGIGVEKDCPGAALYYKELCTRLFVDDDDHDNYVSELLEKKRLDHLYFNSGEPDDNTIFYMDTDQELAYLEMNNQLGNTNFNLQTAALYYFGLRGEKRDFTKAFEYYYRAASKNDLSAKVNVAIMLIYGLGVEKDVKRGISYLDEALMKNDARAKNLMGKLYYYGEGVEQDESKAMEYFKEAANGNYSDGHYNYGVLLLEKGENKDSAIQHINTAATSGHSLAMFHLGLMYLEGTYMFYSCDLGTNLIKTASERGPWSRKLRDAYYAYRKKNYKLAAIFYMEASMIAYDMAPANAALIVSKNQIFDHKELDISQYKNLIESENIYKVLKETKNFKPPQDTDEFLHEEILQVLTKMGLNQDERKETLKSLIKYDTENTLKYKKQTVAHLLEHGAALDDPLAQLMLGDLYQLGTYVPQNSSVAYQFYSGITYNRLGQQSNDILSQAYYYMAEMNHHGVGRAKNLTKAIDFYNRSMIAGRATILSWVGLKMAQLEKIYRISYADTHINALDERIPMSALIIAAIRKFEEQYAGKIVLSIMCGAVGFLFLVRMRLKNYIDLYLKE